MQVPKGSQGARLCTVTQRQGRNEAPPLPLAGLCDALALTIELLMCAVAARLRTTLMRRCPAAERGVECDLPLAVRQPGDLARAHELAVWLPDHDCAPVNV